MSRQKETTMRVSILALLIFMFGFGLSVSATEITISERHGSFYRVQRYVVLHHTEVNSEEFPRQFDIVDRYHRDSFVSSLTGKPYLSALGRYVGYTFFCERDGSLLQARLVGEETTAQLYHNLDSISICFAGDYDDEWLTEAQVKTLREFLLIFQDYEFMFHREIAGDDRSCPGRHITRKWINKLMGKEWVAKQEAIHERNNPQIKKVRKKVFEKVTKRRLRSRLAY